MRNTCTAHVLQNCMYMLLSGVLEVSDGGADPVTAMVSPGEVYGTRACTCVCMGVHMHAQMHGVGAGSLVTPSQGVVAIRAQGSTSALTLTRPALSQFFDKIPQLRYIKSHIYAHAHTYAY